MWEGVQGACRKAASWSAVIPWDMGMCCGGYMWGPPLVATGAAPG